MDTAHEIIPDQKFIIHQVKTSNVLSVVILAVVGVLGVGVILTHYSNQQSSPWISIVLSIAVIGFGLSALLSWRQMGEYEVALVRNGRFQINTSQSSLPLFDVDVHDVKIQRLKLPSGAVQIYVRGNQKALEIAQKLPQKEREQVAQHLENIIEPQKTESQKKERVVTQPITQHQKKHTDQTITDQTITDQTITDQTITDQTITDQTMAKPSLPTTMSNNISDKTPNTEN